MSTHTVEVVPFTLEKLENSDFLSIAQVKGWQCVVRTKDFEGADKAIYIPVDSIVPDSEEFAFLDANLARFRKLTAGTSPETGYPTGEDEEFVRKFEHDNAGDLSQYVRKKYRRVKTIKLRGVISQGILLPILSNPPVGTGAEVWSSFALGTNVAELMGITKYEPPEDNSTRRVFGSVGSGFLKDDPPLFHRYTEIENIKNYPGIIEDGEKVVYSEKIHGSNLRIGLIGDEFYVGSHKKLHVPLVKVLTPKCKNIPILGWICKKLRIVDTNIKENPFVYWKIANLLITENNLKKKLRFIQEEYGAQSVIVHGEIFGETVQDLTYGIKGLDVRIFDISVNGSYLDWDDVCEWARVLDVKTVPVMEIAPFNKDTLYKYSNGDSTIAAGQMKEGCVVRPVKERWHPNAGRVIFKSIGDEYWLRKHGTENH